MIRIKRYKKRILCASLAAALLLGSCPLESYAEEEIEQIEEVSESEGAEFGAIESEATESEEEIPLEELSFAEVLGNEWDGETLFDGYFENRMLQEIIEEQTGERSDELEYLYEPAAMASVDFSNRLSPLEQAMVEALTAQAKAIAAGKNPTTMEAATDSRQLSSLTKITITNAVSGLPAYWTAADLGLSSVAANGVLTSEAVAAAKAKLPYDTKKVMKAFYKSCPYALYWADLKCYMSSPSFVYDVDNGGVKLGNTALIWYTLVNSGYADTARKTTLTVDGNAIQVYIYADPSRIANVQGAAVNAASIVTDAEANNLSDAETLRYYFDVICDLASYNYNAVYQNSVDPSYYGDPWQVIYLFDGDPSTKIVCEGYSKGFQYLCDMTEFDSEDIYAYPVSGDLYRNGVYQDGHMWNIVHNADGYNYLVDITNCDTTTPANDRLYMVGSCSEDVLNKGVSVLYQQGVVLTYKLSAGNQSDALIYTKEELTLKALEHDYKYASTVSPTTSKQGYDIYRCTVCGAEEKRNYKPVLDTPAISVRYRTHVQNIGDQSAVRDGAVSGTYGQAKRLEGIWIDLDTDADVGIRYTTHIQNLGWVSNSYDGVMSGTSGRALRLEAIMIDLYGADASLYDVYYRVHAQNFGWLGWAKNGAPAGTAGYAYRLEGVQIVVVTKGTFNASLYKNVQGVVYSGSSAFVSKSGSKPTMKTSPGVEYTTHVQNVGWQEWSYDGEMAGTSGRALRLEGIKIALTDTPDISGSIQYQTHIQNIGWESGWKSDGSMSGTSGRALRLEAIRIRLTGEMAKRYDVYYRVHAQNIGWMGWAKNGAEAGTAGYAYRLEGIQIVLVKKGGSAPGTVEGIRSVTSRAYQVK